MRRALVVWSIVAVVLAAAVVPVMAQEAMPPEAPAMMEHAAEAPGTAEAGVAAPAGKNFWQFIAAAFAIGIAASFGALGQGRAISAACDAMGRNPGGSGAIRMTMIIGLALIESLVIYALVISFMILKA